MNRHDPSTSSPDPASSNHEAVIGAAAIEGLRSISERRASATRWSIEDLLRPEAFPHEVSELQLRETHISWVILTGSFAYKIKKPVKLDFIDASTLERRRRYCEEELRLNRRLASDLYLGVVAITLKGGRAVVGTDGPVVDHAVRMRQFSAAEELPSLIASNDVDVRQITALGQSLAEFHLDAAVAPSMLALEKTEQMYDAVFGNLQQLLETLGPRGGQHPSLNRLAAWARETAGELATTFQCREHEGFVRECHGDLHTANIVRYGGQLVPFDCIEFEPHLRWIDVIDDVSFLVMDLMSLGRADLALALLSRYLEVTGDYSGIRLLPFYAMHRALVRAKVDALTAQSVPARSAEFRDRFERRLRAAESWTTQRQSALILMHGVSGSGKSWLSSRLVPEVPAIRIRSDRERKRLVHLAPTQSAAAGIREGIYAPRFTRRTYGRLADCAEDCLRAGFNVIVDASFLEAADRKMFQGLATRLGARCMIVSCQSDPVTLSKQVLARSAQSKDVSDATLAVLHTQLRELAPFASGEQKFVIAVDTHAPNAVQSVAQEIRARCAS